MAAIASDIVLERQLSFNGPHVDGGRPGGKK